MKDRRNFLLGATGAIGAAAVTSGAASAATRNKSLPQIKSAKGSDFRTIREDLTKSFVEEDKDLRKWLQVFDKDVTSLSSIAVKTAGQNWNKIAAKGEPKFDPRQVEQNLSIASSLLDDALRFRNELAALEIAAVNEGLHYQQGLQSLQVAEYVIANSSSKPAAEALSEAYRIAAGVENKKTVESERTLADADAAKNFSNFNAVQHDAALSNIVIARNSLSAHKAELLQQGSAKNFKERYLRLLPYYMESLGEAYQRSYAASLAFTELYGPNSELELFTSDTTDDTIRKWSEKQFFLSPYREKILAEFSQEQVTASDVVDALVAWCRNSIDLMEAAAQHETEFTVLIPLRQEILSNLDGTRKPLVSAAQYTTALDDGSGIFEFKLTKEMLFEDYGGEILDLDRVRMIGVGLLVSMATPGEEAVLQVYSGRITVASLSVAGAPIFKRPPVTIGRIKLASQSGPSNDSDLVYSDAIHNLKPDTLWKIRISQRNIRARPQAILAAAKRSKIDEVLLAIRIRAFIKAI